jgi:glucose uptake protein GlcU
MQPCGPNEVTTDFGCFPNDPIGFVQRFYGIGLALVGMVALIALIIGGYTILTSQGDQQRVRAGKAWIFYAIGGLLLAIFGYVIIQALAGDILKIPGFS